MALPHQYKKQFAFTIVELLIVIVVIGILAAITIVAYNGIQQRARASQASTALSQAKKKLEVYKVDNGSYPVSGSLASAGITDSDVDYQYTSSGTTYCLTATAINISYKVTESSTPTSGGCAGHGQGGVAAVTNLASNPSAETNTSGVGGYNGAPVSRDSVTAVSGTYSFVTTTNSATTQQGLIHTITTSALANTQYSCSLSLTGTAGAAMYVSGRPATSSDGYLTEGLGAQTVTLNSSWQRVSISFTTPANTGILRIQYRAAAVATGVMIRSDSIICTQGSTQYNYADGNTTDWVWNGTPNNSASTGPPV